MKYSELQPGWLLRDVFDTTRSWLVIARGVKRNQITNDMMIEITYLANKPLSIYSAMHGFDQEFHSCLVLSFKNFAGIKAI